MEKEADFFLTAAGESEELTVPRACWVKGRLGDSVRDDHMLIEIRPPLGGQRYGLGSRDITTLVLSARYQGVSLFPITEWPCHVYISRMLDETITRTLVFSRGQTEIVAWAMIFRSLDEANAKAKEFQE